MHVLKDKQTKQKVVIPNTILYGTNRFLNVADRHVNVIFNKKYNCSGYFIR